MPASGQTFFVGGGCGRRCGLDLGVWCTTLMKGREVAFGLAIMNTQAEVRVVIGGCVLSIEVTPSGRSATAHGHRRTSTKPHLTPPSETSIASPHGPYLYSSSNGMRLGHR
jgi:hypothetical protein